MYQTEKGKIKLPQLHKTILIITIKNNYNDDKYNKECDQQDALSQF